MHAVNNTKGMLNPNIRPRHSQKSRKPCETPNFGDKAFQNYHSQYFTLPMNYPGLSLSPHCYAICESLEIETEEPVL